MNTQVRDSLDGIPDVRRSNFRWLNDHVANTSLYVVLVTRKDLGIFHNCTILIGFADDSGPEEPIDRHCGGCFTYTICPQTVRQPRGCLTLHEG